MATIYNITNVDTNINPKYDSITNPRLLAKVALMYASLAACKDNEVVVLLQKARRALCKEINRLLSVNINFVSTSYFHELARLLGLFCDLANRYDSKRVLQ